VGAVGGSAIQCGGDYSVGAVGDDSIEVRNITYFYKANAHNHGLVFEHWLTPAAPYKPGLGGDGVCGMLTKVAVQITWWRWERPVPGRNHDFRMSRRRKVTIHEDHDVSRKERALLPVRA
jgi:hypothetical protein